MYAGYYRVPTECLLTGEEARTNDVEKGTSVEHIIQVLTMSRDTTGNGDWL